VDPLAACIRVTPVDRSGSTQPKPGPRIIDWQVEMPSDPDHPTREEIARLRDGIRTRITDLITELSAEREGEPVPDPPAS
jgi:hypothetical protein